VFFFGKDGETLVAKKALIIPRIVRVFPVPGGPSRIKVLVINYATQQYSFLYSNLYKSKSFVTHRRADCVQLRGVEAI
jgi:hypothetical protein